MTETKANQPGPARCQSCGLEPFPEAVTLTVATGGGKIAVTACANPAVCIAAAKARGVWGVV